MPRGFRFGAFDVETTHLEDGANWRTILVAYIDSTGRYVFSIARDLWGGNRDYKHYPIEHARSFVLHKLQQGYWIYAHNTEFDVSALFEDTPIAGLFRSISFQPFIWRMRGGGRLLDLMNIYKMPLSTLARIYGTEKLEARAVGRMPRNREEWLELIEYCLRDAEIVYRAVEDLWNRFRIKPQSAPQLSYQVWRRHYMQRHGHEPPRLSPSSPLRQVLRRAYYGGRTEAYYLGPSEQRIYYYDVNSLYPSVMRDHPYPVGGLRTGWYDDPEKIVAAEVVAEIPESIYIPPLPYRHPKMFQGRLVFPAGGYWGWIGKGEILLLEELGIKYKIIRSIYSPTWEHIFTEYIEDLYNKRLEAKARGDEALQYHYKLLLNSLYGKFGQRNKEILLYQFEGGGLDYDTIEYESSYYLPYAVLTSSLARHRLHQYLRLAGDEPGRILYTDTDSLITTRGDLPTGKELGRLKLEYQGYITIYREKMYRLEVDGGEIFKAKGLRKNSVKILVLEAGELVAEEERLTRWRESHRRRLRVLTPEVRHKEFRIFHTDKRIYRHLPGPTYPHVLP